MTESKPTNPTPTPDTAAAPVSTKAAGAPVAAVKKGKKKKRRSVTRGVVHIHASYNNTIVTFTDQQGAVLSWASAGQAGFKGPKKSTPYAAGIVVKMAAEKVRETGLKDVDVEVKGIGSGREAAIRALGAQGLNVIAIRDLTPIAHNGVRRPKPRRV